jgi:hypothetical protein
VEDWLPTWVEELGRAYCLWWRGTKLPEGLSLWGMSIVWWGRLGQCLQFVGSAVIIIDIVGPERVRDWGYKILSRSWLFGRKTFNLLLTILLRLQKPTILTYWIPALSILIVLTFYCMAFVFAVFYPSDGMDVGETFYDNLHNMMKIFFLSAELFVQILMLLAISFSVFFNGILIFFTVVAKIMIHPKGEKIFQTLGLIAILVGVHFTLLAS